jgi:hypothetical protein
VRPAPSRWRWPLVGIVLIASTLAVSFVGLAALPTGILLAALLAARPPARAPAVIGALGGAVCAYSAVRGLLAVGGDPDYSSRLGFGIVAFVLGLLATFAAPLATVRPRLAALTMLLAGTLGFLAINLYYINTWYGVGWLLLLAASGWALVYPLPVRPPRSEQQG